ncbi:MAG: hypothetical protein AUJ98_10590 [Bacteroidetes bacterium CG2_30_33_31]|nr:MAG: hypothetical protein AUJ98_10590 [Bacteroidetes bacterium CG2_30_33_31]
MKEEIPKKMKAIIQKETSGALYIEYVDIPPIGKGEVLVKMERSPINPSDLSMLKGSYAEKPKYPLIPGIEGSGTVVKAGKGLIPKIRFGKRVSCTSTHGKGGSWAEYMVTSAMNVIPIGNKIDFNQAASLIVNPLTANAFIDIAKSGNHKCIMNNAAAGALGKMLQRLADKEKINLINIVRDDDQINSLKKIGAKNILNSSRINYLKDLKIIMEEMKPTLIFDAVGGEQTKYLVEYSPFGSIIMPYSNLSENNSTFDPRLILQMDKKIIGFFLGNYTSKQNIFKLIKSTKKIQKYINQELSTDIANVIHPKDINNALELYISNMSSGKILIDFTTTENSNK